VNRVRVAVTLMISCMCWVPGELLGISAPKSTTLYPGLVHLRRTEWKDGRKYYGYCTAFFPWYRPAAKEPENFEVAPRNVVMTALHCLKGNSAARHQWVWQNPQTKKDVKITFPTHHLAAPENVEFFLPENASYKDGHPSAKDGTYVKAVGYLPFVDITKAHADKKLGIYAGPSHDVWFDLFHIDRDFVLVELETPLRKEEETGIELENPGGYVGVPNEFSEKPLDWFGKPTGKVNVDLLPLALWPATVRKYDSCAPIPTIATPIDGRRHSPCVEPSGLGNTILTETNKRGKWVFPFVNFLDWGAVPSIGPGRSRQLFTGRISEAVNPYDSKVVPVSVVTTLPLDYAVDHKPAGFSMPGDSGAPVLIADPNDPAKIKRVAIGVTSNLAYIRIYKCRSGKPA